MVFKNGVKKVQAVAYDGTCTCTFLDPIRQYLDFQKAWSN